MYTPTLLGAIALSLALTTTLSAREQALKEKSVPPAILTAFHTAYPQAKALGYSKETEDGKTFYEVESVDGTMKRDLQFLADGTLLIVEEAIANSALPAAVTNAIAHAYPKSVIHNAEKITEHGTVKYEAIVETGKRWMEIVCDGDGKIVKREIKRGGGAD